MGPLEDIRSPALILVVGLGIMIVAIALIVDAIRKRSSDHRARAKEEAVEHRIRACIEALVLSAETNRSLREALPAVSRADDLMLLRVFRALLVESQGDVRSTLRMIEGRVPVDAIPIARIESTPRLAVVAAEEADPFPKSTRPSRISQSPVSFIVRRKREPDVELRNGALVPRERSVG